MCSRRQTAFCKPRPWPVCAHCAQQNLFSAKSKSFRQFNNYMFMLDIINFPCRSPIIISVCRRTKSRWGVSYFRLAFLSSFAYNSSSGTQYLDRCPCDCRRVIHLPLCQISFNSVLTLLSNKHQTFRIYNVWIHKTRAFS